ncbi:Nonribosomal peptide synthetase 10 [Escovopsis weberi]|uniref:Nonribosomal peptide synthetase etpP n=1 Tax=Escovopsis weberi TaxID=150374 RepID=ETPP_ESCWE|nr:Nonribosomal peptide synthetase 10 [Escovopsis weberi]DAB41661.1 TPA_exp: nonribosomal peptide synthetase [Escovopsis weberi]
MAATPSILSSLPSPTCDDGIFSNMHTVILGGETAAPELLATWVDVGVRVLIGYGVTETTSTGCIATVERHPSTGEINPSLIGASMEESPVWLLDGDGDLRAIEEDFVEGEIVISGAGLAKGYYKDDVRTARAFLMWQGETRVYRTGDFGRWVRDSAGDRVLEFRGRKDRTVKNRGFLVNLDKDVEDGLLRAGVPMGAIEEVPLSSNGKVQHKKVLQMLAAIDRAQGHPAFAHGEETDHSDDPGKVETEMLEEVLLAARHALRYPDERTLLGSETFVEIGGSSLSAFKFVALLRQRNLHIEVRDIFSCLTLEDIARKVSKDPCGEKQQAASRTMQDPTTAQKLADLQEQACSVLGLQQGTFEIGPLTSFQLDLAMPTLLDDTKSVNQVKLVTEVCLTIGCGAQIVHRRPFRMPQLKVFNTRDEYEKAAAGASMAVGLGCKLEFFVLHPTASTSPKTIRRVSIPRGTEELTIALSVHHSLIDGVSLKLLLDKIELTSQGRSPDSPCGPSASFFINASLGLMAMQKQRDAEARAFFADYLKDVPAENSATKRHSIGVERSKGGAERQVTTISIESSVGVDEVMDLAARHCVSPACIYYTAWAMAIGALEGSSSVVIGAVFSNRACQPEFENAIGPCMSTLPLVVRLPSEETVASCLRRTMSDLIAISEFAWVRADQVGIGRRMGNLLAMQLPLPDGKSNPPPLRVESLENSDFPLSLLMETSGGLRILYDTTVLEDKVVRRIGDHFKQSVRSLLSRGSVGDCIMVNQLHEKVLKQAEEVRSEAGQTTVKRVLESSIDRFADKVALEDCRGAVITYKELDTLTNIIAHHINATLLSDARAVAIYGDGTTGWILGLIGILKTGRVFVPLDPKWPMDRRTAVCEKSGAVAVLLPAASQQCEAPAGLTTLAVDAMMRATSLEQGQKRTERLPDSVPSDSSDLVIVFTSGTTGTPKGIPISNKGFLALQSNPEATMFAAPGRRIAQFMSPAFDYCNVEIFSALLHGGTLVLRDPLDPYAHLSRVNTVTMTPSVLSVIDPDDFPNLEVIYATGEPLTAGLVNKFAARSLLYNAYGPAECCICTSFTRMIPGDAVTIGRAIDTARMYILDEEQHEAPDGVRGELYLAGVQVLREYINAPEKTLKHILPDPFHPGEQMYRTGDYALRSKDGRITYLGRIDRQVKIRGFRVELAGVEHAIMSGPRSEDVSQAAAFAVNGTLAACIAFGTHLACQESEKRISQIRERLGNQLLPSWVPQVIFSVQQFPKTANSKVDTGALEAMYANQMASSRKPVAPSNDSSAAHAIEGKLAEEWRRVLQLDANTQLQDSDDFFSLGGHSILIMLLSTRLTAIFKVSITARELLPEPTFQGQVAMIQGLLESKATKSHSPPETSDAAGTGMSSEDQTIEKQVLGDEDLTELERQVWFQYQVATKVTAFNIANILHIQGQINVDRLIEALNAALASDPVLRTNMVEGPCGPKRQLRSAPPAAVRVKRLNTNAEVNYRFNLEHDELIRVHVVLKKHEEQSVQVVIVTSHSISDLGTIQNLLLLTSAAYNGNGGPLATVASHDRPHHLNSARWTRRPSSEELKFWREYLIGHGYKDQKESLLLQRAFSPSPLATFQGASRTREFSGRLITRLNLLMKKLGMTHHQVGLTAAALLLHWLSGEDDVVLGAPSANRTTPSEREALGQFLDRLPIRVKMPCIGADSTAGAVTPTLNEILSQVRDSSRLALANVIPFSNILEALEYPGGALHHPLFDCMVTFHPRSARLERWLQLSDCTVTGTPMFAQGAKFPLMMEWFELDSDRWSLHIEHDTNHLLPSTVDIIEDALETILDAMGEECALAELESRLADLEVPDLDSRDDSLLSMSSRSPSPRSSRTSAHSLSVEKVASTIQREMAACLDFTSSDKMSSCSSFFSAGADSAAVVSLRHRLQKMGLDVSVRAIFVAQSPLKLAEYVVDSRE